MSKIKDKKDKKDPKDTGITVQLNCKKQDLQDLFFCVRAMYS